jgi:hypothetical protein
MKITQPVRPRLGRLLLRRREGCSAAARLRKVPDLMRECALLRYEKRDDE